MSDEKKREYFKNRVAKMDSNVEVMLFGSSIIRHLEHKEVYASVWIPYLSELNAHNLGVSGDYADDTLTRLSCAPLDPESLPHLKVVLLHTDSNDAKTWRDADSGWKYPKWC